MNEFKLKSRHHKLTLPSMKERKNAICLSDGSTMSSVTYESNASPGTKKIIIDQERELTKLRSLVKEQKVHIKEMKKKAAKKTSLQYKVEKNRGKI